MNHIKALSTLLAVCLQAPLLVQAGELTLEVQGLDASRLGGARLMVAAYSAPEQWMGKPVQAWRFELADLRPEAGRVRVSLTGLSDEQLAQPLALTVYQDANANGRLDKNAFGMPIEPYGFSNDATGNFGPPRFEGARFQWVPGQVVRITLN